MTALEGLWSRWPVRALVLAAGIKLGFWLLGPAVQSLSLVVLIDGATTLVVIVSLGYLFVQGSIEIQRRLLWRVRRKLILSYLFIGLIPVLLVGAFFAVAGTLTLLSATSFLVTLSMDDLVDQARGVAELVALDLESQAGDRNVDLLRYRQGLQGQQPDASLALVGAGAGVGQPRRSAGPWPHGAPPAAWPVWLPSGGRFSGLVVFATNGEPRLVARAMVPVISEWAEAVVVDLPVDAETRRRVQAQTGVELAAIGASAFETGSGGLPWLSFLEHTNWNTGESEFLNLQTMVDPMAIYQHVFVTQGQVGGGGLGYAFLVALVVIGGLFLVIEGTALVMGLALARSITGAVHELFVGTEHVRQGDFGHRIVVETRDQLGELADSFNAMTGSVRKLLREAAEKKRLEEELRIARRIQMSLLPRDTMTIAGVTVSATCVPAREVGGDYYEFIRLGDRQLGILVADVSGKGTSAAFSMAELKGVFLSLSPIHASPKRLLVELNRIIAPHIDDRSFITMMYVVLDLDRRTLTYARAGHTPMIYVRATSGSPMAEVLAPSGLVVGLDGFQRQFDQLIEEDSREVGCGDVAVLFTDGISEAMNDTTDLFGEERLRAVVESHAGLEAPELRQRILRDVGAFVGSADQHDDMTLVLFKIDDLDAEAT